MLSFPLSESTQAVTEQSIYIGFIISSIVFGVYCAFFVLSVYFLWFNDNISPAHRRFYISYSIISAILNTMWFTGSALNTQMMWINDRNNMGGSLVYLENSLELGYLISADAAKTAANILDSLLMTFRCYIIFNNRTWALLLPFLGTIILAVLFVIVQIWEATGDILSPKFGGNLNMTSYVLSMGLNAVITLMICGRLLFFHYKLQGHLEEHVRRTYLGICAILVESATVAFIAGIISCVLVGVNSPIQLSFSLVWCALCALASQHIILRASMGYTWKEDIPRKYQSNSTHFGSIDSSFASRNRSEI